MNVNEDIFARKQIQDRILTRITAQWKINSPTQTLTLQDGRIEFHELMFLTRVIKVNLSIVTLDLFDSRIGLEGTNYLVEGLKSNQTVKTLNLGYCLIKNVTSLSEMLRVNRGICTLILSGNTIGDDGAMALSEALKTNRTMTRLSLRCKKGFS